MRDMLAERRLFKEAPGSMDADVSGQEHFGDRVDLPICPCVAPWGANLGGACGMAPSAYRERQTPGAIGEIDRIAEPAERAATLGE
ncbi:hypothetical protein [Burkholderia diffusa]|uniref:hypothetical protein n=1 Tax=Burkholderia diffusa TaxID=488732 RepID=UPI001FC81803|nr:hypothetical protein [Burkholderia diffusa]